MQQTMALLAENQRAERFSCRDLADWPKEEHLTPCLFVPKGVKRGCRRDQCRGAKCACFRLDGGPRYSREQTEQKLKEIHAMVVMGEQMVVKNKLVFAELCTQIREYLHKLIAGGMFPANMGNARKRRLVHKISPKLQAQQRRARILGGNLDKLMYNVDQWSKKFWNWSQFARHVYDIDVLIVCGRTTTRATDVSSDAD